MFERKKYAFHPYEIAICGYSGSGKTTLIENVLKILSAKYQIAYIKHDAHRFQMDKEGKDTWRALHSGANEIFIHNDTQSAHLSKNDPRTNRKPNFLNLDFAIVEGHKSSSLPKLIVLGVGQTQSDILKNFHQAELSNILGFIGPDPQISLRTERPYFQRNDHQGISKYIVSYFTNQMNKTPLYGLILTGGQSQRMGTDKGALNYHGKAQSDHMAELLDDFCERTFLSCRENQVNEDHLKLYPQIHDSFLNIGPMGGILSAFQKHPEASWLVLACDLPFVDKQMLEQLTNERDPFKTATCFINPEKGWAEPLCTIYEPKAFARFLNSYAEGYTCPRKMLMNSSIKSLEPKNIRGLENANTPEDFERMRGVI